MLYIKNIDKIYLLLFAKLMNRCSNFLSGYLKPPFKII